MAKYKLTISYDGTHYCGWQVQKNGVSIQSLIQKALETTLRHSLSLTGSSRTDSGVHALGQTAHFDTEVEVTSRLLISLNALLPKDIRVVNIEPVSDTFHARHSARSKIYHYHLHLDPVLDPFVRLYRHHIRGVLHVSLIEKALPYFLGTHDFTTFANHADQGSASRNPVRTIQRLEVIEQKGGVRLEFEANGFLYKMVRNITGTLLHIGRGKMKPEEIPDLFAAKDRCKAPMSAPPQALFLMEVVY